MVEIIPVWVWVAAFVGWLSPANFRFLVVLAMWAMLRSWGAL